MQGEDCVVDADAIVETGGIGMIRRHPVIHAIAYAIELRRSSSGSQLGQFATASDESSAMDIQIDLLVGLADLRLGVAT